MPDYKIHLDNKYGQSTVIDIPAEIAAAGDDWFNQTLTTVNDAVVRLGVIQGEFHWHKHVDEDEFFLVLDGQLLIDIDGGETVIHRTRAPRRTVLLMVESAGVVPTGD
jgi:mannose-6-phosphate isomerase-like protein (cupin superfamily)